MIGGNSFGWRTIESQPMIYFVGRQSEYKGREERNGERERGKVGSRQPLE